LFIRIDIKPHKQIRAQYLKLIGVGFLIFILVFVSHDFEVGNK